MKSEMVKAMQNRFDSLAQTVPGEEVEFWFARDLQKPLGYARWENFFTAIPAKNRLPLLRAISPFKPEGRN